MSRLFPTVALLLGIGILFAYAMPTYTGAIAAAKNDIARGQAAIEAANAFAKQEQTLKDAKANISSTDLKSLETLLPGSVDNVGLILDLNALASRTGLVLSNVNVADLAGSANDPNAQASVIGRADLTLSATGTYGAFRSFLDGVERSERILDLQSLSVTGSQTGVYTYNVTLRLYWLR